MSGSLRTRWGRRLAISLTLATAAAGVIVPTAPAFAANPALRHEFSRENPLIILGYYPGTAETEGGTTMAATWAQIPTDLRDNIVVNLIPDNVYPGDTQGFKDFVTSNLAICQANAIPCSVQALHGGSSSVAPAVFWSQTAATYSSFVGINVAELYWGNVSSNGPRVTTLINAAGDNGLIFSWTDSNHGNITNYLENTSTGVLDAMRAHSGNVVLMNKETEANTSTDNLFHGLWLAGIVGNWGSATDQWHWAEQRHRQLYGPNVGSRTWKDNLQNPEALMAQSIQRAASQGATAFAPESGFLMFSTNSLRTAPFQYGLIPLFRDLDSGAVPVPSRQDVLATTKVVYQGAAGFNPPTYDTASSNVHPNTGQFGIIPLVPNNLTAAEMSVFPEVVPADTRYPYFNSKYPQEFLTSNTFLLHSGNAWYWNNFKENVQHTLKSSFKPRLSNAAAISIAAEPHTYATMVESASRVSFRLNNYRSNRSHVWTESVLGVPAGQDFNRAQTLQYIHEYLTVQRDASGNVVKNAAGNIVTGTGRIVDDRSARDIRTTRVTIDGTWQGGAPLVVFEAMDQQTGRPYSQTQAWDAENERLTIAITHNGQVNFTVDTDAASPASPNIAAGKTATQSSTYEAVGVASKAVDGSTDGDYSLGGVTHTQSRAGAWWRVDLGANVAVGDIEIWNRTDATDLDRLTNYTVSVRDAAGNVVWSSSQPERPYPSTLVSAAGAVGRYVQVQLNGTNFLSLAEVKVRPFRSNLASAGVANQSSTLYGAQASRALDGNADGNYGNGSVTHTTSQVGAWWQVDLGGVRRVESIDIWNRTDCCGSRLGNFTVSVLDASGATVWSSVQVASPNPRVTLPADVDGRIVKIQLNGTNPLSLAEVRVLGH
ncbi:glycoside hydrolase family 98 domain-containing protein [Leifsonia sp. A12D58]|uniref:galactose-binding domain-containing protein n=1 Tax=Leifsonia sp. A12D58 TaxID=3397674 RepID=UPI0039E0E11F